MGRGAGDAGQASDRRGQPGRRVGGAGQGDRQERLGVVDEGGQLGLGGLGQLVAEGLGDLAPHGARGMAQQVIELLVSPVDVRQVVVGALGQSHDRPEIDHLDMGSGHRRVALAEQPEQPQALTVVVRGLGHR